MRRNPVADLQRFATQVQYIRAEGVNSLCFVRIDTEAKLYQVIAIVRDFVRIVRT